MKENWVIAIIWFSFLCLLPSKHFYIFSFLFLDVLSSYLATTTWGTRLSSTLYWIWPSLLYTKCLCMDRTDYFKIIDRPITTKDFTKTVINFRILRISVLWWTSVWDWILRNQCSVDSGRQMSLVLSLLLIQIWYVLKYVRFLIVMLYTMSSSTSKQCRWNFLASKVLWKQSPERWNFPFALVTSGSFFFLHIVCNKNWKNIRNNICYIIHS